jgi:ferredoxin
MSTITEEAWMKIVADKHKCVGAGTCVVIAPTVFDQDDADGIVVLLQEEPGEELRGAVAEAVDFCPAQALMIVEKG